MSSILSGGLTDTEHRVFVCVCVLPLLCLEGGGPLLPTTMDSTMQGPPVQGPPVQGPPAQGPRKSQLSKSLADVLRDNSAHTSTLLEYFIQFMEHAGALHLVQFWLSVESFKSLADNPANRTLAASGASAATATVVTKGHYRHKSAVTGSSQWKQATELGGMSSGRNAASKATDSQQDSGQMSPGTQTGSGAQAGSGTQTGSGAQANSGAQTSSGTQAGSSAAVNNKVQLSTEKAENSQLLMSSEDWSQGEIFVCMLRVCGCGCGCGCVYGGALGPVQPHHYLHSV